MVAWWPLNRPEIAVVSVEPTVTPAKTWTSSPAARETRIPVLTSVVVMSLVMVKLRCANEGPSPAAACVMVDGLVEGRPGSDHQEAVRGEHRLVAEHGKQRLATRGVAVAVVVEVAVLRVVDDVVVGVGRGGAEMEGIGVQVPF